MLWPLRYMYEEVGWRIRNSIGFLCYSIEPCASLDCPRMSAAPLLATLLLADVATAAAAGPLSLVEPPMALPAGWRVIARSPKSQRLELMFAVKQQQPSVLHDRLMAMSTPTHTEYGKHMTNKDVNELIKPTDAHSSAVLDFLANASSAPVHSLTPNGDVLSTVVTVEVAEALLGATYHEIEHAATGVRTHRAVSSGYRLPSHVATAVDFVAPTVHVPGVRQPSTADTSASEKAAPTDNVPSNLRTLYSIGLNTVGRATGNKMAVTAFLGQDYSSSSLHSYWSTYCTHIECGKGEPRLVGDATSGSPGVESMLDIQTITGVAGNVTAEFWGFAGVSDMHMHMHAHMPHGHAHAPWTCTCPMGMHMHMSVALPCTHACGTLA